MAGDVAIPQELGGSAVEEEIQRELSPAEAKFREERASGLGGTEAAAIAGIHPYKTAWEIWAERKGVIPEFEGNERTEIGTILEEPVARLYAKKEGVKIRRVNECWRDPKIPFFIGHPDRLVVGRKKGLEIKTFDGRLVEKWSQPGEPTRVPEEYYCQVQWYMSLKDYELWDLAVLMGLKKVRTYTIERNEQVIAALRSKAEEFWTRYIIGDEIPPMEASDRAAAYLKEKFPKEADVTMISDTAADLWVADRKIAAKAEAAAKARKDDLDTRIKAVIGEHTGIVGPGYEVTWKKTKDHHELVTDWQGMADFLAARAGITVTPEIVSQFTRDLITKPGSRRINFKELK